MSDGIESGRRSRFHSSTNSWLFNLQRIGIRNAYRSQLYISIFSTFFAFNCRIKFVFKFIKDSGDAFDAKTQLSVRYIISKVPEYCIVFIETAFDALSLFNIWSITKKIIRSMRFKTIPRIISYDDTVRVSRIVINTLHGNSNITDDITARFADAHWMCMVISSCIRLVCAKWAKDLCQYEPL